MVGAMWRGAISKSRLRWLEGLISHGRHDVRCFGDEPIIGAYTPITKKLWLERIQHAKGTPADSPAPTELISRPPKTTTIMYPFDKDYELKQQYCNPWNYMRVGRILEDLDSLAGNIAYEHCDDGNQNTRIPVLVTAAVDQIRLKESVRLDGPVSMFGQAVWTGRSSMDIKMEIMQGDNPVPNLAAMFTFVARDAVSGKSCPINPLTPQTDSERAVFAERQAVHDKRRKLRETHKSNARRVSDADKELCEGLLAKGQRVKDLPALSCGEDMLMADTSMQNIFICQPQQRNIHGRMFGGFLMRRAFELAFSTSYMFGGSRPAFQMVDDIIFRRPVNIGDLLRFSSRVKHVGLGHNRTSATIVVEVVAAVMQPERLSTEVANTFDFVFKIEGDRILKEVVPATMEEAQAMLPYQSSGSTLGD